MIESMESLCKPVIPPRSLAEKLCPLTVALVIVSPAFGSVAMDNANAARSLRIFAIACGSSPKAA
jgi:hypothetical protein